MLTKSYVGTVTIGGIGALVLAVLAMRATTPLVLGPIGVTVWFIVILAGLFGIITALAYGVALKLQPAIKSSGRRAFDASRRGLLVAGYLTVVLALSSLRQLNLRDVLLLGLLLVLVEFYTVARS